VEVLVVVPTLGQRPDLLRGCLRSLTGQSAAPRVVVVAAHDVEVVKQCASGLDVEVLEQRSSGLSEAINEGWQRAGSTADAWTWLGDDDQLLPGATARTAAVLAARPDAVMVYGRCRYVDEAGRLLWTARPGRLAAAIAAYGPNLVPQPGSLLRASAVRSAGGLDASLRYAMDIDLFLRLKRLGRLVYVPYELALFRWHATSTTVANQDASQRELRMVQDRQLSGAGWAPARLLRPAAEVAGHLSYSIDRRLRPATSGAGLDHHR
jgi:GT2 family glycosyltransferase